MDKCMPQKSIRTSSRDPVWMPPLVKCMLRTKSRISLNNKERLSLFNKRISEVITENRRKPAVIGSGDWWKGVDALSQRRRSSSINLDYNSRSFERLRRQPVLWWQLRQTYWYGYPGQCKAPGNIWAVCVEHFSSCKGNGNRTRYPPLLDLERLYWATHTCRYSRLEFVAVYSYMAGLLEEGKC